MSVQIAYEGQLNFESDSNKIIDEAQLFAEENEMPYSLFERENVDLLRIVNGSSIQYRGDIVGISIQPHENSDPFTLEFMDGFLLRNYCKTQYASIEAHIKIINFIKKISIYFNKLKVSDDGEFWLYNDPAKLENRFNYRQYTVDDYIEQNALVKGPFRIQNGRVIDFIGMDFSA